MRRFLLIVLTFSLLMAACRRETVTPTPEAATATPLPATVTPAPTMTPLPTLDPDAAGGDFDWEPQVVFSSPQPGQSTPLSGAITVRFDQPMDQSSVAEAFSVAGADGAATGELMWPRPDTLIFTPQASLTRAQSYTVRIADTARAANGKLLRDSFELQFETAGFLEVSQMVPAPGSADVDPDAVITLFFNRPVVPLVSTGQQADLPQPLSFEPAVSGAGEWTSTSIYRFTPDTPLRGDTTYQLTVDGSLTDITGGVLAEPISAEFTTVSPRVVRLDPAIDIDSAPIAPDRTLTLTFNMPMERAATESAISLSPDAAVDFNWREDSRQVGITPQSRLELGTQYSLAVDASATDAGGNATLDPQFSKTFRTFPLPAVETTQPEDGSVVEEFSVDFFGGVYIAFVSPMDFESLEDQITVSPTPAEVTTQLSGEQALIVRFDLDYEMAYEVTIPASAADIYGNTLGEAYSFTFRTPPAPAVVSFNLPFRFAQLSTAFPANVDIVYRNVDEATATLYRFDELPASRLIEGAFETQSPLGGGELVEQWSFEFEERVGSANIELADGRALEPGIYRLQVNSAEVDDERARWWLNQDVLLVVADTNLVIKETPDQVHVWATDLSTGQPVGSRNLRFYYRPFDDELQQFATAVTDSDGFASVDKGELLDVERAFDGAVMVVSEDQGAAGFGVAATNWTGSADPYRLNVPTDLSDEAEQTLYIWTDRPIYRPGDTVYIRGWMRDSNYARYSLPAPTDIELVLNTPDFNENPIRLSLPVSELGAFFGEVEIPDNASLGQWSLGVEQRYGGQPYRPITVAEFRRPEILVTVTPAMTETVRGGDIQFTIEADFFFGADAAGLELTWSAFSDPFIYPYDGPGFYSFTKDNLMPFFFDPFGGGFFGQYVADGAGQLDGEGRLVVTIPASALDNLGEGSRVLTLEARVLDTSQTAVSGRGSTTLHAGETYVGIRAADVVSSQGAEATVDLITLDWHQNPVAEEVEVIFFEREWRSQPSTDGSAGVQWLPVDTEVARSTATTGSDGQATAAFTPTRSGVYVAEATVVDGAGRSHSSNTVLYIYGGDANWRFDPREQRMDLVADRNRYVSGDTAEILVQTPFSGPQQAWLTIERGEIIEQRLITLGDGNNLLQLPLTVDYAPNIFVTVTTLKPANSGERPFADIRYGVVELKVDPSPLTLDLEITASGERFEPGDTVTYELQVSDQDGNPVQADVALSLVDLAILTLKEDPTPPLLTVFYAEQPLRSRIGSGLLVSGEGLDVTLPRQGGGFGGGGGGGVADSAVFDLARDQGAGDDGVRSDFRDTAYWEAQVLTDANGRATVEVPLPDNLTTWRLVAKAVTPERTLVGETQSDIVSTKFLLLRPVTPRFFTVGDESMIGAIVNNNSDQALAVDVTLEVDGLTLISDATQTVDVAAGGQTLVRWQTTADDVQFVDMTFRAAGGEFSDATKPTVGNRSDRLIPVYRYNAEDIVATSGVLDADSRRVEAVLLPPLLDDSSGSVAVNMTASLAAAVLDSLEAFTELGYDSRCAYSAATYLLPNVVTADAVRQLELERPQLLQTLDEQIALVIGQLVEQQHRDGGWGWCSSEESDDLMTLLSAHALAAAQQAGYDVPAQTLSDAVRYLRATIDDDPQREYEANQQAYLLYVLALAGEKVTEEVDTLIDSSRDLLNPMGKALLLLAYDAAGADGPTLLLNDLNDSVVVSATGAHWESSDIFFFDDDIRTTSFVIAALAAQDVDNPLAPNGVRWLMAHRNGRYWSSDTTTAYTLTALSRWMVETGELDADFDYTLEVNGERRADGSFVRDNVTEVVTVEVPLSELNSDDLNFFDLRKDGSGRLYYSGYLDAFIAADAVEAVDRGFHVERRYYDASCDPTQQTCEPIGAIAAGQTVRVELTIVVANNRRYVRVEDPLPAGVDAIDPNLDTSSRLSAAGVNRQSNEFRPGFWGWWYFNRIEFRDEMVVFVSDFLPAGSYQYTYEMQAVVPGTYQVRPTLANEVFEAEVFGRSDGMLFTISE